MESPSCNSNNSPDTAQLLEEIRMLLNNVSQLQRNPPIFHPSYVPDDGNAVIYIVVVLSFYSFGIVTMVSEGTAPNKTNRIPRILNFYLPLNGYFTF